MPFKISSLIIMAIVTCLFLFFTRPDNDNAIQRPFNLDLKGKIFDISYLRKEDGSPININGKVMIHIYLPYCGQCKNDRTLFAKRGILSEVVGLNWYNGSVDEYTEQWRAKSFDCFVKIGMRTAPVTFVINDTGVIQDYHIGMLNIDVLDRLIGVKNR